MNLIIKNWRKNEKVDKLIESQRGGLDKFVIVHKKDALDNTGKYLLNNNFLYKNNRLKKTQIANIPNYLLK